MPDWLTKEQRSRNMAAIRSQGTKPEARLGLALRSAFPRRKIVERPLLPGRPDFYMPGLRLLSDRISGPHQSRYIAFYTSFFGIGIALS